MQFGLYYHIPYCFAKCKYCNFYTHPGKRNVPEDFVFALLRELKRHSLDKPLEPDTIYFGGGTPSLLSPIEVALLIEKAQPKQGAEITLEANPETITLQKLQDYRSAGVTRISFGVQSANDENLRLLGRPHTAEIARNAFKWACQAGFDDICGDIMLALPNYTNTEFDKTLELISGEGANHISAYLLKIEENSYFGKHIPKNLPNAEQSAEFYLYAVQKLAENGFEQYEISNFAKNNRIGKHNMIYWDCGNYLGIGPAAHSCVNGKRFFYEPDVNNFINDNLPITQDGLADADDYLMLQLRLAKGLNCNNYKQLYGKVFSEKQEKIIAQCVKAGYAKYDGKNLKLTPSGLLIQNAILEQII